jgi:hypothetical protein
VLDTPPGGDAYYILAHQYIAAALNVANGATIPDGLDEHYDSSTAWLGTALPGVTCSAPGSCGVQKTWAGLLDDFNNGEYPGGPPHCQ